MRYVKNYVCLYVYIEFCAGAMVEMKKYIKPEIEIVEFDVENVITISGNDYEEGMDWEQDAAFYGIEAGEEGYIVNNY